MTGQEVELIISHLGGMGDGVAQWNGRPVFVPFTAPGDRITAVIERTGKDFCRARMKALLEPGPDRQAAPCVHFSECGGCMAQHFSPDTYRRFKQEMLAQAIRRLGYDPACLGEMIEIGAGARRRAEFAVTVHKGEVRIGFSAPRSHQPVDIAMCPVSREALLLPLPALREALGRLKKPGLVRSLALTELEPGLDATLTLAERPSAADLSRLEALADGPDIRRLTLRTESGELLHSRGEARLVIGGVTVELPVGAFLQATAAGQQAITARVTSQLRAYPAIADIYSGCGSYSFPLAAAGHRVDAYEGDGEMVAAMENAVRRHGLESRLQAHRRDLFRSPLTARELQRFDAAVINPPRNGAQPQVREMAKSGLHAIVMVSCNPATFERDAALLRDAGYALSEAVAIDQFYWSQHLELIAAFRKP